MQSQGGILILNRNNDRGLKFTVGDHVGISKYKSIFAKSYV